jgi:hypothetical protein
MASGGEDERQGECTVLRIQTTPPEQPQWESIHERIIEHAGEKCVVSTEVAADNQRMGDVDSW